MQNVFKDYMQLYMYEHLTICALLLTIYSLSYSSYKLTGIKIIISGSIIFTAASDYDYKMCVCVWGGGGGGGGGQPATTAASSYWELLWQLAASQSRLDSTKAAQCYITRLSAMSC